ncbi:UDP-2,4-diacetamido-2,4,6-trideoxy-beta-L-altropyranose hydrolase [Hymenobacter sp. HSC-4F20]|uniref:UDP-2,4-diacetamido-2,4, 6-trideoxy-beta-L-altropyranose hydrolase n=1 Tax=Hymenobacter sp. HSC-4F20 TaxID=2864135 RepID=UPI001C72F675|nr:UDP-2,4-diacetamido-2,4,6-trideoxy-beta-L-altropyranose hydrolase [Hymenobacter sp. HSC-4F20]MBX0290145.1 UDP-2,4-diacetamido-2,4,6-trideoxy-beta-L-altropyranose hydrolase [Hymenobacter sp. HSC-4F20]
MQSSVPTPAARPNSAASPRLVLRADGNSRIGLGHVMRLLALAEILRPDFAEQLFLIREPDAALIEQLLAAGLRVEQLPAGQPLPEEAATLVRHILRPTDVLVLDGYDFRYEYQNTVRGAIARLVYLDDLHAYPLAADLILNPAGGLTPRQYELRQPGARLLSGPAFAPLRAAFRSREASKPLALPDTVLVCLGGADPTHQTQRVAAELLALPSVRQVHAVVGSAYPGWETLSAWAEEQPRLLLHRHLSGPDLAALMGQCGAAVCSASTVSYEYAAAGGGLLFLLPTADNQHDIDHYLRQQGMALPYPSAANVLTSPEAERVAQRLRHQQRQVFDGLAPVRLRQEFRALQLPPPPFYLRPVVATDSDQLLAWTNEPAVRQFSFTPTPVSRSNHEQWLAARLQDPNALLLLAQDAATGRPAGLIRFAIEEEKATLSYLLDAAFRGRGLAPLLLLAGTRRLAEHFPQVRQVVGYVQGANVPSVRAFERAGFQQLPEASTDGVLTFGWHTAGTA